MPEHEIPPDEKRAAPGYVARIIQMDAEEAEARAAARNRRPEPRWRARHVMPLVAVLLVVSAWNAYRAIREPVVATPAEELVTARFTLYLVAQELEAYRREHGDLPASLEAIDADEERITYARRGAEFTLTAEVAGDTITYRTGADLRPFWQAAEQLPQGGGI